MAQDKLRVAGIGAGYFSQFHYDAWARMDDVALVGIADSDVGKAQAMARQQGNPEVFASAEAMLDGARPDLVDIVTPPATHAALVSLVAARGLPMVCQKPLAPTLEEARAIVATAGAAGVDLFVHENFRFQPWHREMARLLAGGACGEVLNASFRLRPGDGQGPDAYLARQPYFQQMPRFLVHETLIHMVDTFRFLFGEVTAVQAHLRRCNPAIAGEDAGIVVMEFADGPVGVVDGNRLVDHAAENTRLTMGEMWVEGTAGVLRLDGDGHLYHRTHGATEERRHDYAWTNRAFGGDCVHACQRHIVDALRGKERAETHAADYLRNIEIEEAIYDAAEQGVRIKL